MSRLIRFLILFSIGLLIAYQPIHQSTINAQQAAIEDSVKALTNRLTAAAEQVNFDIALSYYSDEYDIGFPNNGRYYPSLDSISKVGRIGYNNLRSQKINVRETKVAVLAPNAAIATVYGDFTATDKLNFTSGSPFVWTIVFAKAKDQWKIVHLHQSFPHHYSLEADVNVVGYRLLGMNKVTEAIEVLKLNVNLFPESSNVYDSLGEAYMTHGDTELAIENYEKSLKLNPENSGAVEMLKKLKMK